MDSTVDFTFNYQHALHIEGTGKRGFIKGKRPFDCSKEVSQVYNLFGFVLRIKGRLFFNSS